MSEESLVPGSVNLRDIGGLPAGGGTTRHGLVYRSGTLTHLEEGPGPRALGALGIRRIVDLRDDDEVTRAPSRLDGLDVEVQRVPLFLGSVASLFQQDLTMDDLYRKLVWDSAERIVTAVRAIAATTDPMVVHCTAGKDRTGVTIALTLTAAGVERDAVIADYARTEALLPRWRNEEVMARLRRRHPENVHLEEMATKSPARVIRTLLEEVDERHGSAAGYLREHGMPDEEIAGLRTRLVAVGAE
jgi:protein-tyrosine phosphatase